MQQRIASVVLCIALLVGATPALAGPEVGEAAPPFSFQGSDGKTYTQDDFQDRELVLAWFPKAFTPG